MARRSAAVTATTDRPSERRLVLLQRKVAAAYAARAERDRLLAEMNASGYTQTRLAGLLNRANDAEGVDPITDDLVYKAIRSLKAKGSE